MKIDQAPVDTEWKTTQSHRPNVPKMLNSDSLQELRDKIQALADEASTHKGKDKHTRGYGLLSFRYEIDDNNMVTVIHSYFKGRRGVKFRFMRLTKS